jgi:hypothetical protein
MHYLEYWIVSLDIYVVHVQIDLVCIINMSATLMKDRKEAAARMHNIRTRFSAHRSYILTQVFLIFTHSLEGILG